MLRLSVIIPAYNDLEAVLRCKTSVVSTTNRERTELLVQDDCSPAVNMPPLLGSYCQRNPVNLGFPANCNAAAQRARGDVLLFLNQDCWIDDSQAGWDERLLDVFELETNAGVVGPTLLFPDGRIQSVGGGFDAAGQPYHVALGYSNPEWEPVARARKVAWVTGAAFAVGRTLWNAIGGFDPVYGRGYFEDVDFCLRARELGADVWHRPAIQFYHGVGSTGGNPDFLKNAHTFKARWVDTDKVERDTPYVKVGFWA